MNQRLDALRGAVRLKGVTFSRQDREQVVDVARIALARHGDRGRNLRGAILRRDCTAPRGPVGQVGEACAKDSRLYFIEPAIDADFEVVVPRRLAAVTQPLDARGELRVAVMTAPPSPSAPRFLVG